MKRVKSIAHHIGLLLAVMCVASCFGRSAATTAEKSYTFLSDDGLRCVAFDYAAGLMVTSAHCTSGDVMELSDGRTAQVLSSGDIASARNEFQETNRDIALLLPSRSKKPLGIDLAPIALGTILFVHPPDAPPLSCPLVEQNERSLIMDCIVAQGWSGSPVMRIDRFGRERVVGVLSAFEPEANLSWATHIAAADLLIQ